MSATCDCLVPIRTRSLSWPGFRRHDVLTWNYRDDLPGEQMWQPCLLKLTWYLVIRSCFICSNLRLSSFWRSPFFCARPTYTCLPFSSLPFMSSTACKEMSDLLAGQSKWRISSKASYVYYKAFFYRGRERSHEIKSMCSPFVHLHVSRNWQSQIPLIYHCRRSWPGCWVPVLQNIKLITEHGLHRNNLSCVVLPYWEIVPYFPNNSFSFSSSMSSPKFLM